MTSNPASRARTATCSAAFEWPSRPGLATSIRSLATPLREAASATRPRASASAARSPSALVAAPVTPVGGRYSPNTSRSAARHSPLLHVRERSDAAAPLQHVLELLPRLRGDPIRDLGHDLRPLEQVFVLE